MLLPGLMVVVWRVLDFCMVKIWLIGQLLQPTVTRCFKTFSNQIQDVSTCKILGLELDNSAYLEVLLLW
jgi:hypothetical protein